MVMVNGLAEPVPNCHGRCPFRQTNFRYCTDAPCSEAYNFTQTIRGSMRIDLKRTCAGEFRRGLQHALPRPLLRISGKFAGPIDPDRTQELTAALRFVDGSDVSAAK
jgi:hypothetical protein